MACHEGIQERALASQRAVLANLLHTYGGSCIWEGRLGEVIRDYSRTLELEPSDFMALSGRGQVFAEAGELRRAIEDPDLALLTLKTVSRPDSSWDKWYEQIEAFVHNGRGFVLAGRGESGPAINEFETSTKLS